jgi:hypothetical protein
MRSPAQAVRQLPDQSTALRVDSSSTDGSRLRGALPIPDLNRCNTLNKRAAWAGTFESDLVSSNLVNWATGRSVGFWAFKVHPV